MKIEKINIEDIKLNPDNPRFIKDDKYDKLKLSIIEFPEMLDIRPIVVDEDMIVLGGNMRLKACLDIGLKEVNIIRAQDLTDKQKKEFILKDNQVYGEWDNELLGEWDKELLLDSGFEEWETIDIYGVNDMENKYTKSLEGSNFQPDVIDVDDYIKQNILFFNEFYIEFIDDEVKESLKNIKFISDKESFIEDIKKVILQYGENTI